MKSSKITRTKRGAGFFSSKCGEMIIDVIA